MKRDRVANEPMLDEMCEESLAEFLVDPAREKGTQPIADVTVSIAVPFEIFESLPKRVPFKETASIVLDLYRTSMDAPGDQYFLVDVMFDYETDELFAICERHTRCSIERVHTAYFETHGMKMFYESREGGTLPLMDLLSGFVTKNDGLPQYSGTYRSDYCTCFPKLHLENKEFNGCWTRCSRCSQWCHGQCLGDNLFCEDCA